MGNRGFHVALVSTTAIDRNTEWRYRNWKCSLHLA